MTSSADIFISRSASSTSPFVNEGGQVRSISVAQANVILPQSTADTAHKLTNPGTGPGGDEVPAQEPSSLEPIEVTIYGTYKPQGPGARRAADGTDHGSTPISELAASGSNEDFDAETIGPYTFHVPPDRVVCVKLAAAGTKLEFEREGEAPETQTDSNVLRRRTTSLVVNVSEKPVIPGPRSANLVKTSPHELASFLNCRSGAAMNFELDILDGTNGGKQPVETEDNAEGKTSTDFVVFPKAGDNSSQVVKAFSTGGADFQESFDDPGTIEVTLSVTYNPSTSNGGASRGSDQEPTPADGVKNLTAICESYTVKLCSGEAICLNLSAPDIEKSPDDVEGTQPSESSPSLRRRRTPSMEVTVNERPLSPLSQSINPPLALPDRSKTLSPNGLPLCVGYTRDSADALKTGDWTPQVITGSQQSSTDSADENGKDTSTSSGDDGNSEVTGSGRLSEDSSEGDDLASYGTHETCENSDLRSDSDASANAPNQEQESTGDQRSVSESVTTTETSDFPSSEAPNANPMTDDNGEDKDGAAKENKNTHDLEMVSPHPPAGPYQTCAMENNGKDEDGDAADTEPVPDTPAVDVGAHASHPLGEPYPNLEPEDQGQDEERSPSDNKRIPDKLVADVVAGTSGVLDCEEYTSTGTPVSKSSKSDRPRFELNISTKPIWFEIVVEELISNESLTSTTSLHRPMENGPIFGWKADSKLEEIPSSNLEGSHQAQLWRINGNKVVWMRIGGGSPPNDHRQLQEIEARTSRRVIEEELRTGTYNVTRIDRRYISSGNCVVVTVYV